MAITLIILSLATTCFGQLIYPDDKLLQATTVSPNYFVYSQLQSSSSSSRLRPLGPALASQPAPQNTLEDWKNHVSIKISLSLISIGEKTVNALGKVETRLLSLNVTLQLYECMMRFIQNGLKFR